MLGSPAGPGGSSQRGLWPLAPAPAPSTTFSTDGLSKTPYLYSLFPGGPTFGSALYSHASTIGRFASGHIQQSSGNAFHTAHKVSDSLFSTTGYTFGAPTPPPGSPYSPIPVAQLELLTKGYSNNIIIQQSQDFPSSPKKLQITEKRCDEKCCSIQKTCSPSKKIQEISLNGCSRTNPIEWTGVNVKKEPGTPCQVAEITTSMSPVVKLEVTSPTQKSCTDTMTYGGSMINGAQIPVGIAVARQGVQHEVVASPSLPPTGLLATVNTGGGAQIKEIDNAGTVTSMAAGTSGAAPGGGTLLQCADDRTGGLATWSTGGNHSQTLATPTLWQYPAPVPVEPMVPLPVPTMPPVGGFQLVRDPTTGGLLLLPTTTGIEPIQQTVVWPSYPQPSSVLLPSISSMQPPPLQLLSSASSDYLSSSTTLHQHTQTHSRLVAVTTDTKRKIPLPLPATTLIKIETDGSLDQSKALQAVSTLANSNGTVFTDQSVQPLVTTHVIYQHPTNLHHIVSQTPMSDVCRSQATSPACLTPPPDHAHIQEEEQINTSSVQDANIQTDTPICSEDDNTTHTMSDVIGEEKIKELPEDVDDQPLDEEVEEAQTLEPIVEHALAGEEQEVEANTEQPDLSGLELLSNSIVEFENCRAEPSEEAPSSSSEDKSVEEVSAPLTVEDNNLGGLDLLCALAEQRIMEESIDKQDSKEKRKKDKERRREKRRSRKHSDEPKRKKMKRSSEDKERRRKEKRRDSENATEECSCKFKHYKTPESEQEVKKFLESKAPQACCQGEWPCMNAMELDMRIKLAELQKEYREKQQELSQLKPKKHHHSDCPKKKSRKKSTHSEKSSTPPPEEVPVRMEVLRPSKLSVVPKLGEACKRRHSGESPDKETKKRKVGRPKRVSSEGDATETLVAKKTNFVGCLLAAKEKLKQKNKESPNSTPPRYVEETYTHKLKRIKNNNNTIVMDDMKSSKIRPKLKAEATVKVEDDDDNLSWSDEVIDHIEEDIDEEEEVHLSKDSFSDSGVQDKDDSFNDDFVDKSNLPNPCALTEPHLEMDKLRVLTAMGGLFYAGQLNAVEPPDVYSITLDGERGNRPHIMSREEILRDAIVEVSPKSTEELPVGTRLCAYWSQQYRCLYPGSAAEPGTPDPHLDGKFVSVEFDDGDSGRIALQDIRLLPPNYPIMEYDPNPLLSLSKRKRRASASISTEEKHPLETRLEYETRLDPTEEIDHHKEKKRLKKKKRDRILGGDDKRKKKKHKCIGEFCKHKRHHKKHKKHRKHKDKLRQQLVCEIITDQPKADTEEEKIEEEDEYPTYDAPVNADDEVTMDDLIESAEFKKSKKLRDRQESCESRSKMSAFLPARQLWHWSGKGYKRTRAKGKKKYFYYKSIQREKESITVGDAAVFLSTGRPDRPFIGRIEAMWEACGKMVVKVKWFYHPEETVGCPNLQYPGALFESPHVDLNDVQTISHKCEVIPLKDYIKRLGNDPARYATIYDNNDIYYLAGNYHHISLMLKMEPGIPVEKV